jgi:small subunit ribosomal protein S20
MANHVSALKRVRQTAKKTEINRNNRSRVRGALRKMREVAVAGNKDAAEKQFRETVSALDKAIQKGVLHKNTAGRYKSRLAARVQGIK